MSDLAYISNLGGSSGNKRRLQLMAHAGCACQQQAMFYTGRILLHHHQGRSAMSRNIQLSGDMTTARASAKRVLTSTRCKGTAHSTQSHARTPSSSMALRIAQANTSCLAASCPQDCAGYLAYMSSDPSYL